MPCKELKCSSRNRCQGLHRFTGDGALHFHATAAALIPTASGDGRIVTRMYIVTDDPHARHIVMVLEPTALAGLVGTAASIEKATRTGQINQIAQQRHLATQIDAIDDADGDE